jgi:hypothetical protein
MKADGIVCEVLGSQPTRWTLTDAGMVLLNNRAA